MMVENFSTTPGMRPSRLFSARVARKFLTVSSLLPICFSSSWTIAFLSSTVRVGDLRIATSLGSFSRRAPSLVRASAAVSMPEVLTAAVY